LDRFIQGKKRLREIIVVPSEPVYTTPVDDGPLYSTESFLFVVICTTCLIVC